VTVASVAEFVIGVVGPAEILAIHSENSIYEMAKAATGIPYTGNKRIISQCCLIAFDIFLAVDWGHSARCQFC